jgi:hypothetical protein
MYVLPNSKTDQEIMNTDSRPISGSRLAEDRIYLAKISEKVVGALLPTGWHCLLFETFLPFRIFLCTMTYFFSIWAPYDLWLYDFLPKKRTWRTSPDASIIPIITNDQHHVDRLPYPLT